MTTLNPSSLQRAESLPTQALRALIAEAKREVSFDELAAYRPYKKQQLFHALGSLKRERLLRAGNQNGKSFCGGREAAYHLTGLYPAWWQGRRFDRPILLWATGETAESTRDNPQKQLLGDPGEETFGTGAIPRRLLSRHDYGLASGTADLYDYIKVRHVSGGWSMCRFKYYAQGRRKWQGPKVDVVWFDEEPPADIYDEGLARTIASGGMVYITATLLQGMSDVVHRYLMQESPDRVQVCMTIHDAEHISPEQREAVIRSFPAHEREARAMGEPIMGSGLIFPVEKEFLSVQPFAIPGHWPQIGGMDFGWDHPTAWARLAWDRDTNTVYVVDAYRRSEQPVEMHALAIKGKSPWPGLPVAWPHDGNNDTAAGPQLAQQYRDAGLNMRPMAARMLVRETSKDGKPTGVTKETNSVEAGISAMLSAMQMGRFKVFAHLNDVFEELRLYHREDGLIVKERDDLISAIRYAYMDLRFAEVMPRQSMPGEEAEAFTPFDPGAGY